MATGMYNWSRTAGSNGNATYNMAEGMAPSAVNDGIRGLMSDAAQYRDDIAGAIVAGGTSTALTVTSYQGFTSLTLLNGQMIAFTASATSGATATLNVDGLGAKPLRSSTGVELLAGTLIAGTPYVCVYNNSDAVFYLRNFYGNPYNVPLGGMLPFIGSTAPNSSFVFPFGQAISRSTYSTLFTLVSTTYGIGDGSTTFNVPDLRGRALFGKDDMGGSAASRLTTATGAVDGATLGAVGGVQSITLAANQIPSLTSVNASQAISVTSAASVVQGASTIPVQQISSGSNPWTGGSSATLTSTANNSISVAYTNGGQVTVKPVPPAIVSNFILRII
jgi:microcystin-dependent protein